MAAMEWQFSTPTQCSDDVPELPRANPQPPPPPTPAQRLLPPAPPSQPQQQPPPLWDMQPDAERVVDSVPGAASSDSRVRGRPQDPPHQHSAPGREELPLPPPPTPHQPVDRIEIAGSSGGRIEAENLAGVLQEGGVFRLGYTNTTHYVSNKGRHQRNKYPLTDSKEVPVICHLDVICAELSDDIYTLGRELKVAEDTMKQIQVEFKSEGQHEVNYRILQQWKQRADPATVTLGALAKALKDIGRGDLADELRKG